MNAFISLIALLNIEDLPPQDHNQLVCIAYHESKFESTAVHLNNNGTKDYGLFQINEIWLKECKATPKELLKVTTNFTCAMHVYKVQGLTAWATNHKCKGIKQ